MEDSLRKHKIKHRQSLEKSKLAKQVKQLKKENKVLLKKIRKGNATSRLESSVDSIDDLKEELQRTKQQLLARLASKKRTSSVTTTRSAYNQFEQAVEASDHRALFSTCLKHSKTCKQAKVDNCLVLKLLASLKDCTCCN